MFGREEIEVIGPAVQQAQRDGFDVKGPLSPDAAFPLALRGDFRGLVCIVPRSSQHRAEDHRARTAGVSLFLGMRSPS